MCLFFFSGRQLTCNILNATIKGLKNERYKFKCITDAILHLVNKTRSSTDQLNKCHQDKDSNNTEKNILELLCLVNNLINASTKVNERIRIRYEFIGLKLNEIFKTLK